MATQTSASLPSATSTKLDEQGATAAFYGTKNERSKGSNGDRFMDGDRLSSAGAAASLKYANPRDLPSFPSAGLRKDDSAAGAAASLGWANQKSFEYWKPDPSASASKAAMLAKDYKAPPLWQPEQSSNGARAALLAAKEGSKVEIWKPEPSAWGNSAASQAFKSERSGDLSPKLDYGYTAIGRQGSLMAATGAMSGNRKRSDSTPVSTPKYPDEANATANALSAATHANNPTRKSRTEYSAAAGASPFTNMPKEMYTSRPPVAVEIDEKRRSDILHASAVAMAKQMYNMQQMQIDQRATSPRSAGQEAAASAHSMQQSRSNANEEAQPMRFTNLQEAAQKLAQERLAKLHDEHARNREYREYYGEDPRPTSRVSVRGRVRRRASSDGTLDEDKEQSQRIRAQMSLFSSTLSQVDAKKRQKDREALMAVAQRNVRASLNGMDERVFKETGKISPSMLSEWEVKAHAAAKKNSESRMENYGKVNIGGGKFIDQSIVDAAAARNVQPVLDEINAKAEKERLRLAEIKLDQEAAKHSAETQKAREKELKEANRKLKEQDKEEERLRREEEKAAKAEQKRVAKQEKQRSRETPTIQKPLGNDTSVVAPEAETTNRTEALEVPTADEPAAEEIGTKNLGDKKPDAEEPDTGKLGAEPLDTEELGTEEPDTEKPMINESAEAKQTVQEPIAEKADREVAISAPTAYIAPTGLRTSMEMQGADRLNQIIKEGEQSPTSSESAKGLKGWLKTRFRRQSKGQKPDSKEMESDKATSGTSGLAEKGTTSTSKDIEPSSTNTGLAPQDIEPVSTEVEPASAEVKPASAEIEPALADIEPTSKDIEPHRSSLEEVALAKPSVAHEEPAETENEERVGRSKQRASSVSPVSPMEEGQDLGKEVSKDDDFEEARDHFDNDLVPPPTVSATKSASPVRDSKFHEVM